MSDDLVARLRLNNDKWYCREAADAIERLSSENTKLARDYNVALDAIHAIDDARDAARAQAKEGE